MIIVLRLQMMGELEVGGRLCYGLGLGDRG